MLAKAYVRVGMFDKANDALFQTRRQGFVPHIMSCNFFLMNRLIEYGKIDMAVAIYRHLKRLGLNPIDYTYGLFIKALCRKRNFEEVVDAFREMEEVGVNPTALMCSTYIERFCSHKGSDLDYEAPRALRAAKWPIDAFAYAAVIRGFCSEIKLKGAEVVFIDMVNL
ncbi:hypothetical protein VitviT2T_030618 [Vitis vinifera]|uniref:Pentatricopeptide repeat-containing protein n=1 Tax=Vitis vinifera TaxID=29760 RepID=A0ABY9E1W0_VITVI|nr:hypothetical protein VitviT2T_030618 [Vitis vinifera]